MIILLILIILFLSLTTIVVIYNLISRPVIKEIKSKINIKKNISVLIPARNEEKKIGYLLDDLINQNIEISEILVLNDNSTDRTAEIVNKFNDKCNIIKLIEGENLPVGWIGKNWACHQLSLKSSGDILIFIDADVRLNSNSINSLISVFNDKNVSMLSVFPTQIISGFSQFLVTPLMNWILLTFLPLIFVYSKRSASFVAANGQLLIFEKSIYESIGGHKSVKDKIVEDMELARLFKKNGKKIITLLGYNSIFCEMYNNLDEGIKGFSKNFYPGFNTSKIKFYLLLLFIIAIYLSPYYFIIFNHYFLIPLLIILFQRIIISFLSRQKILINLILHPFQMILLVYIGINSVVKFTNKKLTWKNRNL